MEIELNLSLCPKCHCMTKSIKLKNNKHKCGKCGEDKWEIMKKSFQKCKISLGLGN